MIDGYPFETDYRNPSRQQSSAITEPGAINALNDAAGTLDDCYRRVEDRRNGTAAGAVKRAREIKVYRDRNREIIERVNKYGPHGGLHSGGLRSGLSGQPHPLLDLVVAIEACVRRTDRLYEEARQHAANVTLREAGL